MNTPWTYALLLVMLPEAEPADIPSQATAMEWVAIKDVAHLLGTWDRAGNWMTDYSAECRWVQRHARATYHCPPLQDAYRLPSHAYCLSCLEFAEAFRCHLEQRGYACTDAVVMEANQCVHVWRQLAYASDPRALGWAYRRQAMERVREAIGPERYYSGDWGAWAPTHRFREIR